MDETDDLEFLQRDVERLRLILSNVGTGRTRIEDAETGYLQTRRKVARELKLLGVSDPIGFRSLWHWLSYWKANGLATYQSRRDFVGKLYQPLLDAIEAARLDEAGQHAIPFSERIGFSPSVDETPLVVYKKAPEELRQVVKSTAERRGGPRKDPKGSA
jgi:hypothetical protein